MDAFLYFGSLAVGLGILAVSAVALVLIIEGGWWLIAKATGREY
jgi:hypothetical protein